MGEENERIWHPNFVKYTEFMVSQPNYEGLFYERGSNGRVNWVVTGKSENGQKRQEWWEKKCAELHIPIQKGCFAKCARKIHPTGEHVCQCCGEKHSIFYEYPSKRTVPILNRILGIDIDKDNDKERAKFTIREIIENWCTSYDQVVAISKAFKLPIPNDKHHLIQLIYSELVDRESKRFSPGVMSNPPDRFDGFHTYGLCCRKLFDTGRWDDNMHTYDQDRRAYEEWADGDLNLANRLMGEFGKGDETYRCPRCGKFAKMSADHIGPISLGFCHTIYNFAPLCKSCNSAKNNRFYANDVKYLINLEEKGIQVISWHSKYIWDRLKYGIENDEDSKRLSNIMAVSHQNVLKLLYFIHSMSFYGHEFLLRYLHPEFYLYDYRFENFDPFDLSKLVVKKTPLDSKNKRKNQERYIRISFEALEDFASKENRRKKLYIDEARFNGDITYVVDFVDKRMFEDADSKLKQLIDELQEYIIGKEW